MGTSLFFSYAHKDEAWRDELAKHLRLLERQGVLSSWHDRQITPGSEWAGQIDQHLEQAQIILLLISADFLASNYCYDIELKRAMERHHQGETVVIPVILRPVDWQGASFSQLQALPKNAKPVTTWENRDEAFTDIAKGIRRVAEGLQAQAAHSHSKSTPDPIPASGPEASPPRPVELEFPDGQVPLGSPFYLERYQDQTQIEAKCYNAILKPSALIRIKAPRQMGKSSLMARVLDHAEGQGYRTVNLSFQEAEDEIFSTLTGLLKWLCASIAYALGLPAQFDRYWSKEPLGNKQKCSNYLQDYIFAQVKAPLVLGFDEVDRVFQYANIASEFLGMLRAWHDAKKNDPAWQNLRLIITHSQEVYVPLNVNQSPFNVGVPIDLPEFTVDQMADLAQRHGLSLTSAELQDLQQMFGGHPYLIRVALYAIAGQGISLAQILAAAPT
ncbi:MAG TPA: AAA-like domain-containing protein, partial [Leptolyngbyaceae cyanobacterium M65_K2018_010]|nr:AAA-like domain-containing protein [Leptolyngbyaceae cyanobacterium M65_K2018_010]